MLQLKVTAQNKIHSKSKKKEKKEKEKYKVTLVWSCQGVIVHSDILVMVNKL